jgi:aldehyde:ferredoxin oxidoreductase
VDRNGTKGKGKLTVWNRDIRAVARENTVGLVNGAAGTNFAPQDIRKIGERLNNVARLCDMGEGFARKDDSFPKRVLTEPIKAGASKGALISQEALDEMLDAYYEERGWDKGCVLTPEKLEHLGIEKLQFRSRES